MSRILGASLATLLLLGCGQTASRSLISARPWHPRALQGRSATDYALAATVQGAGGAWYHVPSHGASASAWSALWDHAALTPTLRRASESLLQALLRKMEILAYNVANAETIGFKRTRVFMDTQPTGANDGLAQERSEARISPDETLTASERVTVRTEIVFDQGSALQANNLDVMIQGEGFFRVELPDERIGYTRAGHFVRNAEGLITPGGTPELRLLDTLLIPEWMPTSNLSIGSNGEVAGIDDDGQIHILGQLRLARFPNQAGLRRHEPNVFVRTDEAGVPIVGVPGENGLGWLIPGHLEMSNADFVSELLELRTTRQRFDATLVLLRLAAAAPSANHSLAE